MKTLRPITLCRQAFVAQGLHPSEIKTILEVAATTQRGRKFHAGRLGIAAALIRKFWLVRNQDGSIQLSKLASEVLLAAGVLR